MVTDGSFENLNISKSNQSEESYDIKIDRDGLWWHEGAPIKRTSLSKLFSTVLKYDEQRQEYWLITPAEKGRIEVEDVPFVVVDYSYQNSNLTLKTNLDHEVLVSQEHPITLKNNIPYVLVKDNLLARINRAVYYDLIELGHESGDEILIESSSKNWSLGTIDV